MHTAERLDAALALAKQLGYRVRMEHLDGHTGGPCELHGQKWLFVDLALSTHEQLDQVLETLQPHHSTLRPARVQ